MQWDSAAKAMIGALPALVALLGFMRGPGAMRSKLKHDLDMLEKLPEGTDARGRFLEYVDRQVEVFAQLETEAKRDWSSAGGALVFFFVFAVPGGWMLQAGHWGWWIPGVVLAFLAVVMLAWLFDCMQRVPRDEKGDRKS